MGSDQPGDTTTTLLARCWRACDVRYPFLWADASQGPGRWHGPGEGPCHYLATTAVGAWAEVLRHAEITDEDDVADLQMALWAVDAPMPTDVPTLGHEVLVGGPERYPACREEAARLRARGASCLRAPTAALASGHAEQLEVTRHGQLHTSAVASETFVYFGWDNPLVGTLAAEGHPDPALVGEVRLLRWLVAPEG